MEKLFFDVTQNDNCISVFTKDAEVLQAGTTIYSMPIKDKNDEYQKFADCYDIHFIFDDYIASIDFYTIPRVDIMAIDSQGGYIGTVGGMSDMESDMPICYIDRDSKVFWLAKNFKEFLKNCKNWKEQLKPYDKIELFTSKEEAQRKYEFVDIHA
ncbi:hypothetical protein [Anaerosporobacter sp.]|uniref:hypothetical protein n=1 Tax=Anaerosporobacter sp. TaxID=1872529 RepID=UPI00286F34E3|nr:hypothetical protein [Anaerosporobacter sp.]